MVADIAPTFSEKAVNPILQPKLSLEGMRKPEEAKDCSWYFRYRGLKPIASPTADGPDVVRYSLPIIYEPRLAFVGANHSYCTFMLDLERRSSKWVVVKESEPLCG